MNSGRASRLVLVTTLCFVSACTQGSHGQGESSEDQKNSIRVYSSDKNRYVTVERIVRTEEAWKKELTPEQYRITRQKGTERAFTGEYWDNHEKGIYMCVACGNDLFHSDTKFESGTGWPSFWEPIAKENLASERDVSFFVERTEVVCRRCGAHLGHVFGDGPEPTGLRYCINSAALRFKNIK